MDWYPLIHTLRIAALAAAAVFLPGAALAYGAGRLPRAARAALDVVLTLPLALSPTAAGYLLLRALGASGALGAALAGKWPSTVLGAAVVAFPLMYRMARGAFSRFDEGYAEAGRTLGLSGAYLFWRLRAPCCLRGLLAGAALAFARALGEFGAAAVLTGCAPGKNATVSTTIYQLWLTGNDGAALQWALVSSALSAAALLAVILLEKRAEGR